MPDTKPHLANRPELRRLVKGIMALFWGMPFALLVCVQGSFTDWLRPLWLFPPVGATCLILYGVLEVEAFRTDARQWQRSIERAKVFALVNLGLSPFVYFVSRAPEIALFSSMVGFMAFTGLLFLFMLNQSMQRLTDLWPDEMLRTETRLFTSMNITLMGAVITFLALFQIAQKVSFVSDLVLANTRIMGPIKRFVVLLLILMPLAMTMTLLWKIKESILREVFAENETDQPGDSVKPGVANDTPGSAKDSPESTPRIYRPDDQDAVG